MRSALSLAAAAALLARASCFAPAELSNMKRCDSVGLPDLAPYEQRLELGASPYGKSSSKRVFLPVYGSQPFASGGRPNASVTSAVIFIHGLNGNANAYFCDGIAASRAADMDGSSLIVAPWFGNEQAQGGDWGSGGDASSASAFWTTSRWMQGGNISPGASAPPTGFTTAFDALDALVRNISESALFPNLEIVTIVGFSAGAQLSSRYAFATALGAAGAGGPRVRFVVSDPGTFLYLDDARPDPSCRPLRDTGVDASCDAFSVPPEAADCSTYDDYKYGLADGSLAYQNAYLAPLDGDAAAKAAAVARLRGKDVVFIFGQNDVCNCNLDGFANDADACYPGATCTPNDFGGKGCCDTYPSTSNALTNVCEAGVQGSNRLQRGLLYVAYLRNFWAGFAPRVFTAAFGHDDTAFYASKPFNEVAWAI
jgi:pimeloyl-ACP methyl ester carboxylesterase